MRIRTIVRYVLVGSIAVALLSLALGAALGQPILLGYVESGSMEPTLDAGDGYIAIPATLAGDVETGDVVTYESESVNGGELTTHRVVGERDGRYVTRGDANVVTDQDNGEPPITDGQIQAVALEIHGDIVRVPNLGTAVVTARGALQTGTNGIVSASGEGKIGLYLLFGAGVALLAASVLMGDNGGRGDRDRTRDRPNVLDSRLLLVGAIAIVCLAATAAMFLPAGTETYGIVSTEGDSANPTIIPVGETDDFNYTVHNGGVVPTVSYLEERSDGIEVEPDRATLSANESTNATVTLHARDETGYHVESMTEWRYLLVLPPTVIDALYGINPALPYLAVYAVLSTPIVACWRLFGGSSHEVRLRSRSRTGTGRLFDRL